MKQTHRDKDVFDRAFLYRKIAERKNASGQTQN